MRATTHRTVILAGSMLVTALSIGVTPAIAASGTVLAHLQFEDFRGQTCSGMTGCRHTNQGMRPVQNVRVALIKQGAPVLIGSANANSNGDVAIPWNDPTCWFPPCAMSIRVYSENPGEFDVISVLGAFYSWNFNISASSGTFNAGTRTLSQGNPDEMNGVLGVIQTANEFWDRIVYTGSTHLSNHMNDGGDRVIQYGSGTTAAPCGNGTGIDVEVAADDGNERPFAVAHELGHCATDVAYGNSWLQLGQGPYCGFYHTFSDELICESLAFHEGFADFIATQWGFTKDAPTAFYEVSSLEIEDITGAECSTGLQCATEHCIAAMLWDVHDDPPGDDDPIDGTPDVTSGAMINVLVQFADNCSGGANRCSNEAGPCTGTPGVNGECHGRNHWDWLENFDDLFPSLDTEIEDILAALSLDVGCEEPFDP